MAARRTLLIAGAGALMLLAWLFWWRSDERAIRRELANLAADANAPAGEGLGTLSWAARLGTYFTEDAAIDAGQGGAAVAGRPAVVGIATRMQPRFAGATVSIDDVSVQVRPEGGVADVSVTATFRPAAAARDRTIDAREFALEMKKDGRRWRIARATAVDILR